MLRRRHQFFVALLTLVDASVILCATYAAWACRRFFSEGFFPVSWENWIKEPLAVFVVPIGIVCLRAAGLYRPRRDRTLLSEAFGVLRASAITMAALIFTLWAISSEAITGTSPYAPIGVFGMEVPGPRFQLLALAPLLAIMLTSHRILFRLTLRYLRRCGWNQRHVLIIGTGRLAQIAHRTITRNSWTGMRVSGFVTHHETARRQEIAGVPVLGTIPDIDAILEEYDYDAVYLALPGRIANRLPALLRHFDRHAVDVRVIPDVPTRHLPETMSVAELDGMPVLSYRESPVGGIGGITKRLLDLLGALVATLIFLPVMLAIAIAVRMSSPGPVIFRQRRVSIGGEEFNLYKFRTMQCVQDEANPTWTQRDDPRITRIGAFLRRTSLDELPQLLNVIKGEMSLVGPRPERPELIAQFRDDWRGYMLRQHVKAGMTGWAQVNGLRGDTSLRKRLQYDLFYIKNWSVLFDVRILLLTIVRGFIHRNAH